MDGWVEAKVEQDVINLIVVICSIYHKHDDTKQGTMVLVETDMVLYTMWQKAHDSPANFMRLFKAQLDIIYKHGGRAGYHPKL